MRKYVLGLVLVACAAACGCVAPDSFTGYLEDRRQDLIDVANVHVTAFRLSRESLVGFDAIEMGAIVYAGPFQLGYADIDTFSFGDFDLFHGRAPSRPSRPFRFQLGLGGLRGSYRTGTASGLVWPTRYWNERACIVGARPKRAPSGFSMGFSAAYWLGIGAEVDVLEFVDFLLGVFCIDVGGDDEHIAQPEQRPQAEPPKPETSRLPAQLDTFSHP